MTHKCVIDIDPAARNPYRVKCECGWRSASYGSNARAYSVAEMHCRVTGIKEGDGNV